MIWGWNPWHFVKSSSTGKDPRQDTRTGNLPAKPERLVTLDIHSEQDVYSQWCQHYVSYIDSRYCVKHNTKYYTGPWPAVGLLYVRKYVEHLESRSKGPRQSTFPYSWAQPRISIPLHMKKLYLVILWTPIFFLIGRGLNHNLRIVDSNMTFVVWRLMSCIAFRNKGIAILAM
jgi:hypothetical protein